MIPGIRNFHLGMYQEAAACLGRRGWAGGELLALSYSTQDVYMAAKREGTDCRNRCKYKYINFFV